MFCILYRKNLLYWRRGWIGSLTETLLPLILLSILTYLVGILDVDHYDEKSYQAIPFATSTDPSKFPAGFIPKNFMKNCKNKLLGGSAAFAPRNAITEDLANFFKLMKTDSIFFDNNEEIDEYMTSSDYGVQFKNGTYKRLCLAVTFDKFDKDKIEYNYNLRFNTSAAPWDIDHYMTYSKNRKIPFKPDDDVQFHQDIAHGVLTTQILIESFILKSHLPDISQNMNLQKMHSPKYSFSNLILIEGAISFIILFIGMVIYIRTINYVVYERETRNIDNLENMGVKKATYFLSIVASNFTIHVFYGVIFSLFLKYGCLTHTSFFVLYFLYLTFIICFQNISLVLSTFFVNSKKAIIYSIIFFFLMQIPYNLRNNIKEYGEDAMFYAAFSPVFGLGQVIYSILSSEASQLDFNFMNLYDVNLNFKAIYFFQITLVEIVIFYVLALYLFYVVPLSIGVPSHPLFFLGFPFKKKEEKTKTGLDENLIEEDKKKNDNFEEVPEDLKKQNSSNQSIQIENLTKIYNNKFKAVDSIDIDIYTNQIFSLLGHNGAGKTTTVSMISGLINKTSGNIKILGYDANRERNQIKKILGVCTQHNPIFEYMTVREHLVLYANIKGVKKNIDGEIEEVLRDIDLFHKIDYKAKFLSGGQKRKLNVAIAFIGGSKVILLDEPTSGMDAQARRLLWNMIKKYKENRLIILTTHNMDEADNLGDRIAIMSQGKILTCGSSLFLKKKFGAGYELTIIKSDAHTKADHEIIIKDVLSTCPNSKFIMDLGIEMKFKLNDKDSIFFKDLFEKLESEKRLTNSKVKGFGISLTTLEEVFIKVNKMVSDSEEQFNLKNEKIKEDEPKTNDINDNETFSSKQDDSYKELQVSDPKELTLDKIRYNSNTIIIYNQFIALLKKRLIFFSRDIGGLMCQIFIPIFLIIIAFTFTKINFIPEPVKIEMDSLIYPYQFQINNLENITQDILNNFVPQNFEAKIADSNDLKDFDQQMFDRRNYHQNYGFFLNDISLTNYDFIVFQNSTAPFAQYYATNSMHNTLLRYYTKVKSATIQMNLNPMPQTTKIKQLEGTIDGFILVSFMSLAFVLIASSMIIFIIKEREYNAKHQQLISGLNVFAYWMSNFLVDFFNYLISTMTFFGLFFLFDTSFFIEDDHWLMSLLLLIVNGVTLVLSVYVISFYFTSPGKGQVFVFLYTYFFSTFMVLLMFVLRVVPSTSDITMNYLEFIFRLFPPFSCSYGMMHMANLKFYQILFKWDVIPPAFDKKVSLYEFIYLCASIVVLLILIVCIEFSYKFEFIFKKLRSLTKKQNNNNKLLREEVGHENHEEIKIISQENSKTIADIKIENLEKNYKINEGLFNCRKKVHLKRAIKGINFEMYPGTIFGLLGTNGAGKTTTFKILTGDTFPTSGNAFVKGKKMPGNFNGIRKYLGYCPQFDTILDNLTAQEHLELYANIKGIKKCYHKELIDEMIQRMNLHKYRHVKSGQYSGGNKRKLSVAISLLGGPSIILLDEPSAGMDPVSRNFMWSIINNMSTILKNSSILLTTHSMEEAEALATVIAIMVEGKIVAQGTVQQLKEKFGKNFELDLKFKFPADNYYEDNKKIIETSSNIKVDSLNLKDCITILKILNKDKLIEELNEVGKGKGIIQDIKKYNFIKLDEYMQWVFFTEKLNETYEFLEKSFDINLLEFYQSYLRIQISQKHELSKIFDNLESNKESLGIMNYSLKQISIEQIFMNLANNVEHDD